MVFFSAENRLKSIIFLMILFQQIKHPHTKYILTIFLEKNIFKTFWRTYFDIYWFSHTPNLKHEKEEEEKEYEKRIPKSNKQKEYQIKQDSEKRWSE